MQSDPNASADYPVRYDVEYPTELSRWLIFVNGCWLSPTI